MKKYLFVTLFLLAFIACLSHDARADQLGIYRDAEFSPKCTYLIVHGSGQALILESATGKTAEGVRLGGSGKAPVVDVDLVFSRDEKYLLRVSKRAPAGATISYETFPAGAVLWQYQAPALARAGFSADQSRVVVFDYTPGERHDLSIKELDAITGKPLASREILDVDDGRLDGLFLFAVPVLRGKQPKGLSADGKYYFSVKDRNSVFKLGRQKDGVVLRTLRFQPNLEQSLF